MFSIGEVSKMTGVSARTLRYYDQTGLLKPSGITEAGYRLYDEAALSALSEILFFRELDFTIDEILRIRAHPNYDAHEALIRQKSLLEMRRDRLCRLIGLAERAIKGERLMTLNEFDETEFLSAKNQYASEARERWGDSDAYKQSESRTKSYAKADWARINTEMSGLFQEFSAISGGSPDSEEAKTLVRKWQSLISRNFYDCTDEILLGLASMYECDERFEKSIDKFREGTAKFMAKAIRACLD